MALKPRTFRRVVLLGSLATLVLLVAFTYFVIRPWQAQRKLDSMRVDGLAAAQAGDHVEATKLLGRYINRTENPEPELYLAFSRSRIKFQTSDGGYVRSAIQNYRSYLREVPGDAQASKELLPLFNMAGMFLEAKALALTLRTELNDSSIEVLREELHALQELGQDEDLLDQLFVMSVEHPDAQFVDLFEFVERRRGQGRLDDAQAMVSSRMESAGDDFDNKLIAFWLDIDSDTRLDSDTTAVEGLLAELCSVLGLDPDAKQWREEPSFLTAESALFATRLLNVFHRPDLSLTVQIASARMIKDYASLVWSARRLYWTQDHESLMGLSVADADGNSVADVLGYQILAAIKDEDTSAESALKARLDEVVLDFRAKAWANSLKAQDELNQGRAVEARPIAKRAIEMYPGEPYFLMLMGDIHASTGRINDASKEWSQANEVANRSIGVVGWIEPSIRLINAYAQAGRLIEAIDYVNELTVIAPGSPITVDLWLRSNATLARSKDLDPAQIQAILNYYYDVFHTGFSTEFQDLVSPQTATLHASIEQDDEARAILIKAISASPERNMMIQLLDVDQRFDLGVAQQANIDTRSIAISSPSSALRYAFNVYAQTQDIDLGLAIIEDGSRDAAAEDAYQWDLSRAKYLDAYNDPRAIEQWTRMREQKPDDIELLYLIAESKSFGDQIDIVSEVIDRIVEKTSTSGKSLPSRLRLAKASAIFHSNENRSTRQQAIEIVRAVVANEQENINARNMLGRLLSFKPSPTLESKDSFQPDLGGAVEQFVTISRQLDGRSAQNYLLESIDLSIEDTDENSARQYLREFDTRFPNDYERLPEIARRFEILNDPDEAVSIYNRILRNSDDTSEVIDAGLSLVNIYTAQGRRQFIQGLLEELGSEPQMNADQLFRLALLHAKNGHTDDGAQLAQSGERYGLNQADSMMVYARYAQAYISDEEYERVLNQLIELDPGNEDAWLRLVAFFVGNSRFEEAQEFVQRAMIEFPRNDELQTWSLLAQGEPDSASRIFGSSDDEDLVEAASRVDAFEAARGNVQVGELISMLVSMLDDFPDSPPVQRYALSELNQYEPDPERIAFYADRAGRRMPGDDLVMQIAANAYLRAGNPVGAREIAQLWRANAIGSPKMADIADARAMIQLENYQGAAMLLSHYIDNALKSPMSASNAQALHWYSHARLLSGEDPRVTADRIQPLLEEDNELSRQVWLNLAIGSVPTHEESARWLGVVSAHVTADQTAEIGNAWLMVMERFNAWLPQYAQAALGIFESIVQINPENPEYLGSLARAHAAMSRSVDDQAQRAVHLKRAMELMDQADELDPNNLFYLVQYASYANAAGELSSAEAKYRALLDRNLSPSPFAASIMNNLAMVIERQSSDSDKLNEALELCVSAIAIQDTPSYWGTRGWIELALTQLDSAEESFKHAVDLNSTTLEGWVGLAIVQHRLGESRTEDASSSFERVLEIIKAGARNDDLIHRLRNQGAEEWASVLVE